MLEPQANLAENNITTTCRTAKRHVRGGCAARKAAFTLAEVLITLGIIGVVAAMTLPTLILSQQEKEKVVRLKKAYSVLNSAIQRAITEDGPISSWSGISRSQSTTDDMTDDEKDDAAELRKSNWSAFMSHIKPYLSFLKFCNDASDATCAPGFPRYSLDGTSYTAIQDLAILSDGTGISTIWILDPTCNYNAGNSKPLQKVCGQMFVDLKADKTDRKVIGDNVFLFWITEYGLYPQGSQMDTIHLFEERCNISKSNSLNGYGCTAWVLQHENLDYKKCSDLSWNGKHKCK